MGFKRYATAHWEGDLKSGEGAMSTPQSGLFAEQRYSFNTCRRPWRREAKPGDCRQPERDSETSRS